MEGVDQEYINKYAESSDGQFYVYTYIIFLIIFCVLFALLTAIIAYINKKNFEVTDYKVFDDRIDFDEGFINHKHVSVLFKDIKEIHLDQNFVQRKYNIATIRFVTPASNPNNQYANVGVKFQDIENAQYVYAKVKEIHEELNKE